MLKTLLRPITRCPAQRIAIYHLTAGTMLPSLLQSPCKASLVSRGPCVSPRPSPSSRHYTRSSASLGSQSQSADRTAAGNSAWWQQGASQSQPHKLVGSIHLIMGPMFAGKSTALCAKARELRKEGARVAIVNSALDTRSGKDSVATHDGDSLPAVPVQRLMDFVGHPEYEWASHVCIDEAQVRAGLWPAAMGSVSVPT